MGHVDQGWVGGGEMMRSQQMKKKERDWKNQQREHAVSE